MYQKTHPPTPPLSTRAEVEMITAANARHAAALPLDRLAEPSAGRRHQPARRQAAGGW